MGLDPVVVDHTLGLGDDLELDLRAHLLRRASRPIRLERIPMDLLRLLVERRGALVSRQDIVDRVWGPGVFLDTDNSINGAIRKLRQALKDDADQPRFIETVTGKGYRFIAPVVECGARTEPPRAEEPSVLGAQPRKRSGRLWAAICAAVAMVSAVGGSVLWSRAIRAPIGNGRVMLAVLPFDNLTGDATQDYFSDGLTEEMISRLGNLAPHKLGVIARTSVVGLKRGTQTLDRLAHDLRVQYVLEGSVRRDAERVRITAQLIQISDQTHVWARQYDRELRSVLAVQSEIAQAVANEIQLSLGERPPIASEALSPAAYEAYDLYLKGRYFWNTRTADGLQRAIELFQHAVAKDPSYARAYAGLADAYALTSSYNFAPAFQAIPKARAAALRALDLNERLGEAHTSLGLILLTHDWNWKGAEREYRRAIELDPNYATAHHWYAELLGYQGRFDEALAESDRARRLDPLSLIIAADHGALLYFSRQYDRAIEQFRSVLATEPRFGRAHMIVHTYAAKGMYAEAIAELESWRRVDDTPWISAIEAYVHGRAGRRTEALQAVEKLKEESRRKTLNPAHMLAVAYAGMGETQSAVAWLQRAHDEHLPVLTHLKVEPIYDSIRHDPTFQQLLRRAGLAAD
jgi:TolB-like protein/DNA-binding winged helix-turn-helix (wHTH) protein/Tfp pilus assembly protein PilF